MPGQIWTMWFGERFVCASVLPAALVLSSPWEENQECGPEGRQCKLRMAHQGTRIPVCTPHTEHSAHVQCTESGPLSGNVSLLKSLGA